MFFVQAGELYGTHRQPRALICQPDYQFVYFMTMDSRPSALNPDPCDIAL